MPRTISILAAAGLSALALAPLPSRAADLWNDDAGSILRTETISAEVSAGYLTGQSKEYVYDTATAGRPKLSQLTWNIGNAAAVGGRLSIRPLDWLTIRARGWSIVNSSDGIMRDYDWFAGYYGFDTYTHYSASPDTVAVTGWQGDVSAAAAFYQEDDVALTAIGGYRHLTTKWNAKGGRYIYSTNAYQDTSGTLPPGMVGVAYQQWWDTPYLGLGASYSADDWSFTAEGIGSPFVMGRSKDHHNLRDLVIKDDFSLSSMYGVSLGAEYRILPSLSLTGRAEFQKYMVARGDGTYYYGQDGTVLSYPKGAGAQADNVLLSVGLKGRL